MCSFSVLWDRRYNSQRSLVMFLFKQNCLPQANQYGWLTCVSHCLCDFITVCVEAPASSCFMFVEHQERLRKLPGFRLCCSEKKNVSGINISTLVHREKELGTNDTNGQYSVKGRVYWFEREKKSVACIYCATETHTSYKQPVAHVWLTRHNTDKWAAPPRQLPSQTLIGDCKQPPSCLSWDKRENADPSGINRPLHVTQFANDEKSSSMEKSIWPAYNYIWTVQRGERLTDWLLHKRTTSSRAVI